MSQTSRILSSLIGLLSSLLSKGGSRQSPPRHPDATRQPDDHGRPRPEDATVGRMAGSETIEVNPDQVHDVNVGYSPSRGNGQPDSGEVIWTWVPYEENDGRGKDRPVLVIGRHSKDRVYAVRMTSKAHDGDRDFLAIGSGAWDPQRRDSWVDIEQLYTVHNDGMRREAAALDEQRYGQVAAALIKRYGWARA